MDSSILVNIFFLLGKSEVQSCSSFGGLKVGSRVIIPSDHLGPRTGPGWKDRGPLGSHVYYSDDAGASWHISAPIPGGNECQAAEAPDGTLVLAMRSP